MEIADIKTRLLQHPGLVEGINKDHANNDNSHGGNTRWFGMGLSYDWGFGANQLNGNISGNKWRSKGDGQQRAYGFGYDPVNNRGTERIVVGSDKSVYYTNDHAVIDGADCRTIK